MDGLRLSMLKEFFHCAVCLDFKHMHNTGMQTQGCNWLYPIKYVHDCSLTIAQTAKVLL